MLRSERLLMEQFDYNRLFRWFVGLAMDDRMFTKTREPLLRGEIAQHAARANAMCRTASVRASARAPRLATRIFLNMGRLIR